MNAAAGGLGTYLAIVIPAMAVAATVHPTPRTSALLWWALGTATALLILAASWWQRLTQPTGDQR